MKKSQITPMLMLLVGLLMIILAACGSGDANTPANNTNGAGVDQNTPADQNTTIDEEPVVELYGDPLRGGLLYDKWWVPLGLDAPSEDQPLWATQDSNTRGGADTWRCKECHGWDYQGAAGAYGSGSHFTGFVGVLQFSGGDANEVLAALMGETNPDHDFSTVMDEQALTDLALFIAQETVDYGTMIGEGGVAISQDVAGGDTLYQETCTECHGPEGLAINFDGLANDTTYLADVANGNPWEFLHKARWGQPGTEMPSVVDYGWTMDEQGALLAFAQSLPTDSPVTQGGQLYDNWINATDADIPEGDMPLWATQDTNTREGRDTWRCKECHGWDYSGAEGAYGGGSHFTGFVGVSGVAGLPVEDIMAWLDGTNNADHDYSPYMDEASLTMLAAFLGEGQIDMSVYINEDGSANGDPSAGQALYEIGCARCHGEDGQAINFGDDDDPEYLGDLAAGNPWEVMHKAGNGQPAEDMPSALNLGWSWQDIADVVAYLQSLVE